MRKTIYLALAFIMLLAANDSFGQMNRKSIKKNNKRISSFRGKKSSFSPAKRYNAVGISLNALNYYGDLSPKSGILSTDISFTRPAIGISFTHRAGPRLQLTAAFMYGTLKGSDAESANQNDPESGKYRYVRNLSFRNHIKELSFIGSFDLFENQSSYISRVKWTPYVYLGVAGFLHNPQAQVPDVGLDGQPLSGAGNWVNLREYGTEGQQSNQTAGDANFGTKPYKLLQFAIPGGIGARFRINEVMDFSAEFGVRYTFTDYLDDVSKDYADLNVFKGDRVAEALSYRSNEVALDLATVPVQMANGGTYMVVPGYGHVNDPNSANPDADPFNKRGDSKNKDIYMVTTFKLTYIIGKTFHRAKFR